MAHLTDPRPLMRAMIGQLEKSISDTQWKYDFLPDSNDAKPPQWVDDARRTVNEAKAFVAMMDGIYAPPLTESRNVEEHK